MRAQVLQEARRWIDTPYQHQASCRGAGTDCLGLIRGIWRKLYGDEPTHVPPYSPDWAEVKKQETLLQACEDWLVSTDNPKPGDVMLFRMLPDTPCKHLAILSGPDTMIHAYWGRAVTETHLVPYWRRRWVRTFSFPSLED